MWRREVQNLREATNKLARWYLSVAIAVMSLPKFQEGEPQGWFLKSMTESNRLRYSLVLPRSEEQRYSALVSGVQGETVSVIVWRGQLTNIPPPGSVVDRFTVDPFGGCSAETFDVPSFCSISGGTNDRVIAAAKSNESYKRFDRMDELFWIPLMVNRQRNAVVPKPELITGFFSIN